jgi:hypothetical protein
MYIEHWQQSTDARAKQKYLLDNRIGSMESFIAQKWVKGLLAGTKWWTSIAKMYSEMYSVLRKWAGDLVMYHRPSQTQGQGTRNGRTRQWAAGGGQFFCLFRWKRRHYVFILFGRSQWRRGLRHELSSPAPTLRSWVRIPLEAWMFVCVLCAFILCLRSLRWDSQPT